MELASKFYTEGMGRYTIMQPTVIHEEGSDTGQTCTDVFGAAWGRIKIAHLATADRIGFELFEFEGNHAPEETLNCRQHGTFHFAIQDPNLEELLTKIVAVGGMQRMPVRAYFPDEKPYRMVYVEACSSFTATVPG